MVTTNKNGKERNNSTEKTDLTGINPLSPPFSNSRTNPNKFTDELIISLSNAYENRRARQVFEWEKSQKQTLRSTV